MIFNKYSIHFDTRIFDSPKWIKNHKTILIREGFDFGSFWFTFGANDRNDSFWFLFIWFAIQIDSIHFDSFYFNSSRITIHPRIKSRSNQKSQEVESWFTHLRIIGWFDFESKANHSESRIKLVRALVLTILLLVTVITFLKTACEMWSFPDRSRFPFVCPVKMYSRPYMIWNKNCIDSTIAWQIWFKKILQKVVVEKDLPGCKNRSLLRVTVRRAVKPSSFNHSGPISSAFVMTTSNVRRWFRIGLDSSRTPRRT